MFTLTFWKATGERAIKTLAQSAVAALAVGATGLLDVDWLAISSVAGLAAVISLLTSIGSAGLNGAGPSLASESLDAE